MTPARGEGRLRPAQGLRRGEPARVLVPHPRGAPLAAGALGEAVHRAREGASGPAELRLRQHLDARRTWCRSCSSRRPAPTSWPSSTRGAGPAAIGVLSGEAQVIFAGVTALMGHVRAKRVVALAVTSPARSPIAPEIPTLVELGIRGVEAPSWYSIVAPAATPRDVVGQAARRDRRHHRAAGLPRAARAAGVRAGDHDARAVRGVPAGRVRQVGQGDQGAQAD